VEEVINEKRTVLFLETLAVSASDKAAAAASAQRWVNVKARGHLNCRRRRPVLPVLVHQTPMAYWKVLTFDGLPRLFAAAIFGRLRTRRIRSDNRETRSPRLSSGEIDLLARNTTWQMSRRHRPEVRLHRVNYLRWSGLS